MSDNYWGFCDRLVNNQVDKDGYKYRGALEKDTNEYTNCWQKWNGAVVNKKNSGYKKKNHCNDQRKCNFWVGNSEYDGNGWWNDDNFKNYDSDNNWGNGNTNNCVLKKKEQKKCGMYNLTNGDDSTKEDLWKKWSCNYYEDNYISPYYDQESKDAIKQKCIDAGGYHEYGKRQRCHQNVCGGAKTVLKRPLEYCNGSKCITYNELVEKLKEDASAKGEEMDEEDLERAIKREQYDTTNCCEEKEEGNVHMTKHELRQLLKSTASDRQQIGSALTVYNDNKIIHSGRRGNRGGGRSGKRGSRGGSRGGSSRSGSSRSGSSSKSRRSRRKKSKSRSRHRT